MKRFGRCVLVLVLISGAHAKEKQRQWRDGLLISATNESRTYSTPVTGRVNANGQVALDGGPNSACVDTWTYAIDDGAFVWVATRDLYLRWDKPFKTTVNQRIKFTVEKSDIFVLDEDGKEHKLDFQRKIPKADFKASDLTGTPSPPGDPGTVRVSSTIASAEITVDGNFMGNVPATIKLSPGKHEIRVSAKGYKEVSRTIQMTVGSELNLPVELEKEQ